MLFAETYSSLDDTQALLQSKIARPSKYALFVVCRIIRIQSDKFQGRRLMALYQVAVTNPFYVQLTANLGRSQDHLV